MNKNEFHKVRMGRHGSFVGLFRPVGSRWKLWRVVVDDNYGRWSLCALDFGLPREDDFNELIALKSVLDVSNKEQMKDVRSLLGGSKYTVYEKINKYIKLMKKER